MSADPLPSPPCRPPAVVAPAAPATGSAPRGGVGNGVCPGDGAGERSADPLPSHGERRPLCTPPACRAGCGACCIAPSISSPIPGLPLGKPAGMPCPQLDADLRCSLFDRPERPAVCSGLQPSAEMCGPDRTHALRWLAQLEAVTSPDPSGPAGTAAPPSA